MNLVVLPASRYIFSWKPLWPLMFKIFYALLAITGALLIKIPGEAYTLFREIVRIQTLLATRELHTLTSEHFIVKFGPKDLLHAHLVLETAENFYEPVTRDLNFTTPRRIPIIIYPTRKDLNASFGWPGDVSAMGVYWAGIIRVLSPKAWIEEKEPNQLKEIFASSGPVAHELTHLIIDYITKGNVPRWLTEGLAQYEEYRLTGFRFKSFQDKTHYSFKDMDKGFDYLPDQMLAYRQSFSAVQYLIETHGKEKMHKILQMLAKGYNINDVLQKVIQMDVEQFEAQWQSWDRQNGFP